MSRLERSDDRLDRFADLAQRMKHAPPIGWRTLAERYIYGETRIHAHVRQTRSEDAAGAGDELSTPDLSLTYERPRGALGDNLELHLRETWERFRKEHVMQFDGDVD